MSLSHLIENISRLSASGIEPTEVVEQTGTLIVGSLEGSFVEIRLWEEFHRSLGDFSGGRGGVYSVSRRIVVRGIEYGELVLELESEASSPAEFQQFAEVVAHLLGIVAERKALQTRNDRLANEQKQLNWQVRVLKVLSRAAGIVAARRRIGPDAAMEWLCDESLRLRLPVWEAAEMLIERESLVRVLHRELPEPGALRRTA